MKKYFLIFLLLMSITGFVCAQTEGQLPLIGQGENTVGRIVHIGVVMGSWYEMGYQYGERAGEYILINYDNEVTKEILKSSDSGWRKGLSSQDERVNHAMAHFQKSYQELSFIFPELNEFMQGIADGASYWLAKSEYADVMPNFYKIGIIAYGGLSNIPPPASSLGPVSYDPIEDYEAIGGCNGTWISGKVTATGETYASRTGQSGNFVNRSNLRQVSMVCIPKDPNANVFWFCGPAGGISQAGAGIMNSKGVAVLTAGGGSVGAGVGSITPEELKHISMGDGAKDFPLSSGCVIFSDTASEAATKYTVGTPGYRNKTGRKQVLGTRSSIIVFVDPNEAYCVEKNANRFAIRTPGYIEKDDTYLVFANDFMYNEGSFDENMLWLADQPMTMYSPQEEESSSYYRFWTLNWRIANLLDKKQGIDRELMKRFIVTSHDVYDKEGNFYPAQEDRNFNTSLKEPDSPCSHRNFGVPGYPLGGGGNNSNSVMVLSSAEVYYNETHPCFLTAEGHESGYDRPWHYVDLKPYAEYRKVLWGY